MTDDNKSRREKDHDLDEELDDSFPASDPPSSTVPKPGADTPHDKDGKR